MMPTYIVSMQRYKINLKHNKLRPIQRNITTNNQHLKKQRLTKIKITKHLLFHR